MVEESHRITNDILVEGIADVLGIKDKTRIQLEGFDVSEGSKKGDNFACVMKAVEAQARVDKGELQTFHFMAKGTPMNPMRAKWIHEGKIFDKECLVYSKLMPAFAKLQEQHKVLDKVAIPKCHYASLETEVILMENLKISGYTMVDKKKGLDIEHVKMLLDQLSRLHAVSYHFVQTYPGGLENLRKDYDLFFDQGWMSSPNPDMQKQFEDMMTQMYGVATDIIEKNTTDRPELAKRAKAFTKTVYPKLLKSSMPKGDFCVITHGDCWNNNFMFLYDEAGKLESMKMLDLQIMRYSRLSLDLAYFFCSSTDDEIRKTHLESLLEFYHSRLIRNLGEYGYPASVFTFEEFKAEFDDCFTFGFITGTFLCQVILNEDSYADGGVMDMDNITSEEEMEEAMKTFQEKMSQCSDHNEALSNRIVSLAEAALARGIL